VWSKYSAGQHNAASLGHAGLYDPAENMTRIVKKPSRARDTQPMAENCWRWVFDKETKLRYRSLFERCSGNCVARLSGE
jgi:hypothetical protein